MPRSWRTCLLAVAAGAVLIGGCSGHDNPGVEAPRTTVTARVSTTTSVPPVSPAHVVANLGPCPQRYSDGAPGTLNAGIEGLDKSLVPVSALVVRICKYGLAPGANSIPSGLVSSGAGVLTPPAASAFEDETNRLPRADARIDCPASDPPFFILTFANAEQRVDVWEAGGCGFKTNGVTTVGTTTHWLDELRRATSARPGA